MAERIRPVAVKGYFERYGRPVVERNRLWVLTIILSLAVLGLSAAIARLTPLKTTIPYVVRVDANGEVTGVPVPLRSPPPTHAQLRYWLARWTRQLLRVQPVLTQRGLEENYSMCRGQAVGEMLAFIKQYQPLAKLQNDPSLRITVAVESINFLSMSKNGGNVYIKAVTRKAATGEQKSWALTITYALKPPKTVADAYRNPLGIYVSDLSITEGQ